MAGSRTNPTTNQKLIAWVDEMAKLAKPNKIHWCDGSKYEYDSLCEGMVEVGTLLELNKETRPNCFLARSDPDDVARVENRTFICSKNKNEAGPTNNWVDPVEMKEKLSDLFQK